MELGGERVEMPVQQPAMEFTDDGLVALREVGERTVAEFHGGGGCSPGFESAGPELLLEVVGEGRLLECALGNANPVAASCPADLVGRGGGAGEFQQEAGELLVRSGQRGAGGWRCG